MKKKIQKNEFLVFSYIHNSRAHTDDYESTINEEEFHTSIERLDTYELQGPGGEESLNQKKNEFFSFNEAGKQFLLSKPSHVIPALDTPIKPTHIPSPSPQTKLLEENLPVENQPLQENPLPPDS